MEFDWTKIYPVDASIYFIIENTNKQTKKGFTHAQTQPSLCWVCNEGHDTNPSSLVFVAFCFCQPSQCMSYKGVLHEPCQNQSIIKHKFQLFFLARTAFFVFVPLLIICVVYSQGKQKQQWVRRTDCTVGTGSSALVDPVFVPCRPCDMNDYGFQLVRPILTCLHFLMINSDPLPISSFFFCRWISPLHPAGPVPLRDSVKVLQFTHKCHVTGAHPLFYKGSLLPYFVSRWVCSGFVWRTGLGQCRRRCVVPGEGRRPPIWLAVPPNVCNMK